MILTVSPTLLDLFQGSSICSTVAFPCLEIVIIFVSCSIDFPLRSMGDDPFYCKASDYTQTMVFIII